MTARILDPDDHPDRLSEEAFKAVARALRDEVLPDEDVSTVYVMVGTPASGKSTYASSLGQRLGADAVILVGCHAHRGRRRALAQRIRKAGKRAVAVHVTAPLALCEARDSEREPDRQAGVLAISKAHSALHREPPFKNEGWHEVQVIDGTDEPEHRSTPGGQSPHQAPGGSFDVIPIIGEAVDRPSWADRGNG